MKKTKKRKTKKPIIFIQNWGTYSNDTIVAINATPTQVLAFAKRKKAKKEWVDWFKETTKKCGGARPSDSGFCYIGENGHTFMWLRKYEDTWQYWETLIHEISHLIDEILSKHKLMAEETEGKAYQFEYLFRSIRRKLQKIDPMN